MLNIEIHIRAGRSVADSARAVVSLHYDLSDGLGEVELAEADMSMIIAVNPF